MLPQRHRLQMRTTSLLERVKKEVKLRTSVATMFCHEPSLLRQISAVLIEVGQEWDAEKSYES